MNPYIKPGYYVRPGGSGGEQVVKVLSIWHCFFQDDWDKKKSFEFCREGQFAPGDILQLCEWVSPMQSRIQTVIGVDMLGPLKEQADSYFTGRWINVKITYMMPTFWLDIWLDGSAESLPPPMAFPDINIFQFEELQRGESFLKGLPHETEEAHDNDDREGLPPQEDQASAPAGATG